MKFARWMIVGTLALAAGCSDSSKPISSSSTSSVPQSATATPEQAVTVFLEAVRTGNDKVAGDMLTPLARDQAAKNELVVAPSGSPTAGFKVEKVEFVTPEKDGAHVWCTWTDKIDDAGNTRRDDFIWVLRKEEEGWRIAGTVTKVFPDQPPLVLNFEDAADMKRKLDLLRNAGSSSPGPNAGSPQQGIEAARAPVGGSQPR